MPEAKAQQKQGNLWILVVKSPGDCEVDSARGRDREKEDHEKINLKDIRSCGENSRRISRIKSKNLKTVSEGIRTEKSFLSVLLIECAGLYPNVKNHTF